MAHLVRNSPGCAQRIHQRSKEQSRLRSQQRETQGRYREKAARERAAAAAAQKGETHQGDHVPSYLESHFASAAAGVEREACVNVGIIGLPGTGKTALVRAILEHFNPMSESLPTPEANEPGTLSPAAYLLDTLGGYIRLWDLPGYGTEAFPAQTYLQDMGLHCFGAVFMVTCDFWSKGDECIFKALRSAGSWVNIVRTKADQAMEKRSKELGQSQAETLQAVRDSLAEQLDVSAPDTSDDIHIVTVFATHLEGLGSVHSVCRSLAQRVGSLRPPQESVFI